MTLRSNLKELDAAVDNAVIAYSEANTAVLPHLVELALSTEDYPLTPASFKMFHFNESLLDLVIACDERAKSDERLGLRPADPFAWASFARAGIKRAQRREPNFPLDHRARLFGWSKAGITQQYWLYVDAKIRHATTNRQYDASQEKP